MFTVPSNSVVGSATRSRAVPSAVYAAAWNVEGSAISLACCPAGRLRRLLHDDDPVRGTGHGAADVDQVPLRVDLRDAQPDLRVTLRAVVARHLFSFEHARRIRSGADRSRLAVPRVAVRVGSAA